jgi:hypothetical protein
MFCLSTAAGQKGADDVATVEAQHGPLSEAMDETRADELLDAVEKDMSGASG